MVCREKTVDLEIAAWTSKEAKMEPQAIELGQKQMVHTREAPHGGELQVQMWISDLARQGFPFE